MARKSIVPQDADEHLHARIPAALLEAAKAAAKKRGEKLSDLVRRAVASDIGQPHLATTRGVGQPRKESS